MKAGTADVHTTPPTAIGWKGLLLCDWGRQLSREATRQRRHAMLLTFVILFCEFLLALGLGYLLFEYAKVRGWDGRLFGDDCDDE